MIGIGGSQIVYASAGAMANQLVDLTGNVPEKSNTKQIESF